MKPGKNGFTIVELLIVVVIVAILAAITIVAYNGIQDRSTASAIQHDLSNAKKKLLMYQVDNNNAAPASVAVLNAVGIKASKSVYDITGNNFYYCMHRTTNRFAVGGRNVGSKSAYLLVSDGAIQSRATVTGDDVCQAVGLTGWADVNGYISNGYSSGVGWLSWVNG